MEALRYADAEYLDELIMLSGWLKRGLSLCRGKEVKTVSIPKPSAPVIQDSLFLTKLPLEIRLQIYELCFDPVLIPMESLIFESKTKKKNNRRFKHDRYPFAILRTCHQIHAEATPIPYHHIILNLDDRELRAGLISDEMSSHHSFSFIQSLRVTSVYLPWADAPPEGTRASGVSRYIQGVQLRMRMWRFFWEFVKTMMPRLVNLWIEIVLPPWDQPRYLSMDAEWVQPVVALNWLEFLGFRAVVGGAEVEGSGFFEALVREMMCKGGMSKKVGEYLIPFVMVLKLI